MSSRLQIGEFEEMVLLVTAILHGDAYGVRVMDEIENQTGRKISISAVHTALDRLDKKGFLHSYTGGATAERGGRSKRYFKVTNLGLEALKLIRETRNKLFDQIPSVLLKYAE
jgi:PadR family transcriptional regulator PadR